MDSLLLADGTPGSLGFASVHLCAPKGHQVHSGSRGFTRALHKVATDKRGIALWC